MNYQDAKTKGQPFYIGAMCRHCWGRKRYTSDRTCKQCRAARSCDRKELSPADLAELRAKERMAKRAQRAKRAALTPWQIIIQHCVD